MSRARAPAGLPWDWVDDAAPAPMSRPPSAVRVRGLAQSLIGVAIGVLLLRLQLRAMGTIAISIAATLGLVALVSPHRLHARMQRVLGELGVGVGRLLTWILLGGFYLGFFVPFGLLRRRGNRDRIRRSWDRDAATYWETRAPEERQP